MTKADMFKHGPIRLLGAIALLAGVIAVPLYARDKPRHPHTPTASVPYIESAVTFANPSGPSRLAGTLSTPPGPGPFPAIVIVPGSGPVNRDGDLFGHQFYRVLADDLSRRGFAVLRSDKRGLGQSNGSFGSATTADFASDIEAGVAFLRTRANIDPQRIGLVGHSEGGIIAPMVAGKDPRIVFVVMMAGNGIRGDQMLLDRTRKQGMAGKSAAETERELRLQQAVFGAVTADAPAAERERRARQLYLDAQASYGRPWSPEELAPLLTPWMRSFLASDPAPVLQGPRCAVLALVGDKDQVVMAEENIPALTRALAGNPKASVRRLAGLNHFFQSAGTGAFSEVAGIKETIAPEALELIGSWAGAHSRP
ncbi:alpha/beta hydrolase family protein [Massilia genomosp. 1]|uniref:Alpha/beta fold hydrolase n=1 Tax=Massilia genomosp. 1 TaxID=2609280 RepID=A0ABX0N777_9BURK|nr:alpha/beta fold hydrolase [Massilia genomosp. 1]NHZ66009.1 alpha/beta fold hydrolase [Massilia genomosp. 1]